MSLQSTVSLGRVGRVLGGEMKLASRSGSKESISRATTPEIKTPTPVADIPAAAPVIVVNSEPDVVASAKASIQTDQPTGAAAVLEAADESRSVEPVAPPRRRRKAQAPTPPQPDPPELLPTPPSEASAVPETASTPMPSSVSAPSLSSPTPPLLVDPPKKTINSLTRGHEYSLDLTSATKGHYVIKPQVRVKPLLSYQYHPISLGFFFYLPGTG